MSHQAAAVGACNSKSMEEGSTVSMRSDNQAPSQQAPLTSCPAANATSIHMQLLVLS